MRKQKRAKNAGAKARQNAVEKRAKNAVKKSRQKVLDPIR
jgi:hypothetical protein